MIILTRKILLKIMCKRLLGLIYLDKSHTGDIKANMVLVPNK